MLMMTFFTDNLLARKPRGKVNARKMINISPKQLLEELNLKKIFTNQLGSKGKYYHELMKINDLSQRLEKCSFVKNLLTSNKIWEVLVAVKLNHNVNSEQGGRAGAHDAYDNKGNTYEYKVSKSYAWNFQDISANVLNKYLSDKAVILAVVSKKYFKVINIYSAKPKNVVQRLKEKLKEKELRLKAKGKSLRRLQVSLSKGDLETINAIQIM